MSRKIKPIERLRGWRLTVALAQVAEERRFQDVLLAEVEKLDRALVVLRDAAEYAPLKRDRTPDEQERVQAFTEAIVAVNETVKRLPPPIRRTESEVAAALGTEGRAQATRDKYGAAALERNGERDGR